jgi:propanol-preferring alcohol dehydrogenase
MEKLREQMRAMVLDPVRKPLVPKNLPVPRPEPGQVQIRVLACAVCRTDLHVVDGDLQHPKLPLIPGHEVVGVVSQVGSDVQSFKLGDRLGVPWLGWTCGVCEYCQQGRENLCDRARFTGYTLDGGYAEYLVADHRFCFPIPAIYSDVGAAPLLCAGLIGFRAWSRAGEGKRIGLYGFGAAAHIITQVARFRGCEIYAFTRSGDVEGQAFAKSVGATWAGDAGALPPQPLDAAIIFAPAGELVLTALKAVRKAGSVVCAGIHMSDIPSFPYKWLWQERTICSVANLTRLDGKAFFDIAPRVPVRTTTQTFPLEEANEALEALRSGRIKGAAVLVPGRVQPDRHCGLELGTANRV